MRHSCRRSGPRDGDPGSASLTLTWSKVSGPGTVSFSNRYSAETLASFGANGTYSLRLRGSDGLLAKTDLVTVVVSDDPPNHPPVPNSTGPSGRGRREGGSGDSQAEQSTIMTSARADMPDVAEWLEGFRFICSSMEKGSAH